MVAGYQGNTSGIIAKTKITTDLEIIVPLLKYANAVDPMANIGRGAIPNCVVIPTLDDWTERKDIEMEFVMGLTETIE